MVVPTGNNITYSASLFEGKTPKAIRKFLDSWNPTNKFVDEKAFQAFLKAVQSVQDETLRCSTLDRVRAFLDHDIAFYSGEEFVFSCPRALLPYQNFFQMILNSNSEESQKIDGKHQIRSTFSKEALMAFKRYVFGESFDGISPEVLTELHDYLTMISDQNRHEKIEDAILKYFLDETHEFEEMYFIYAPCIFVEAFLSHKKISFEKIDNQYQIQLSDFILLFQGGNAPLLQFLCKKIGFIKADISDFSALLLIDKKYRRQMVRVFLDTKTNADIDKILELRKVFKNVSVVAVNLPDRFLEQKRDVNQQVVLLSAIDNLVIATEKLQEILLENEGLSTAQECLGDCLSMLGRHEEALPHLAKAIELDPKSATAHAYLSECLTQLGRYEEALPHLAKAIELDPKFAFAHRILGDCLRSLGRYEEALLHLKKAIELNPKSTFAHAYLGAWLREFKKFEEAISHFEKAIELNPRSAFAHEGLGDCLRELKKFEEAISHFEKAIELNPQSAFAHERLGDCLRELKEFGKAIWRFDTARVLNPKSAFAHEGLGECLRILGRYEEAVPYLKKAIELDLKSALAHMSLGDCLRMLGRHKEAIPQFEKAIELYPESAFVRDRLVACQKELDNESLNDSLRKLEI